MISGLEQFLMIMTFLASLGAMLFVLYAIDFIIRRSIAFFQPKKKEEPVVIGPQLPKYSCPCCHADIEKTLVTANEDFQSAVAFRCQGCGSTQRWNTGASPYVLEDFQQEQAPQFAMRNPEKLQEFEAKKAKRIEEILCLEHKGSTK